MAKAAKKRAQTRRVFAMEYIRRGVLDVSQIRMAEILGCSQRTISAFERQHDAHIDMIPVHYVRIARAYARSHGIAWPNTLTVAILDGDLMVTEAAVPTEGCRSEYAYRRYG